MTAYHKETVRCVKCCRVMRFPKSGLNHGRIAKILGSSMYCGKCESPRMRALKTMAATVEKGLP